MTLVSFLTSFLAHWLWAGLGWPWKGLSSPPGGWPGLTHMAMARFKKCEMKLSFGVSARGMFQASLRPDSSVCEG